MRTTYAGLCYLLATGVSPCQAQVSGEVSISNLRYHLIDLDPSDPYAPAIAFTLPDRPTAHAYPVTGNKYTPTIVQQSNAGPFAPFSASAYSSIGEAHAFSSGTLWNDFTVGLRIEVADALQENITTQAYGYFSGLEYVLSPRTAVQFASDVHCRGAVELGRYLDLTAQMGGIRHHVPVLWTLRILRGQQRDGYPVYEGDESWFRDHERRPVLGRQHNVDSRTIAVEPVAGRSSERGGVRPAREIGHGMAASLTPATSARRSAPDDWA